MKEGERQRKDLEVRTKKSKPDTIDMWIMVKFPVLIDSEIPLTL